LGALFVACVLGFPRGIVGSISALRRIASDDPEDAASNEAFDVSAPIEVGRGV
jgi:hypothetical protein